MVDSSDVVAGTNATATQYNNLRKDLVLGKAVMGTETYAATVTIDWSDKTKGKVRSVTLTGNPTIAFSNVTIGQAIIIRLIQDGSGNHTVTWPTIAWPGGSAPPLTTTASKTDAFLILCTDTDTYQGYFVGFNL